MYQDEKVTDENAKICNSCGKIIGHNQLSVSFGKSFHSACLMAEITKSKVNQTGFIGRELVDHKINKLNREHIVVETADERSSDNAHHEYKIQVFDDPSGGVRPQWDVIYEVTLKFQNGGLKEVGANGITDQALIAIVLDRLRSFNSGPFSSRDNSLAITHLEDALLRMERRSNDRARRGVEGERKQ